MFNVVIATLGRDTLPQTLATINKPLAHAIVVADTFEMTNNKRFQIQEWCLQYDALYYEVDTGKHDAGSAQLQYGYKIAEESYILNCGDDDVYEPFAFETVALALASMQYDIPMMFRAVLHPAPRKRINTLPVVLWHTPEIKDKNVTGQCIVVPNDQDKIGTWHKHVDYGFIESTIELYSGQVEWRKEVIIQCA